MPSPRTLRKMKKAKALGVNPGDIDTSSSEDEAKKDLASPGRAQSVRSSKKLTQSTPSLADKFSSMPKHANRFALLLEKKQVASESAKRDMEEKQAQALARQQAKDARQGKKTDGDGVSGGDGGGSKFRAPRTLPFPCPAVPCQKDQVSGVLALLQWGARVFEKLFVCFRVQVRRILARQDAVYASIHNKRSASEDFWVVPKPRGAGVPPVSQLALGQKLRNDPEFE